MKHNETKCALRTQAQATRPQLILDFLSLQGRVENKEPQGHPKYKWLAEFIHYESSLLVNITRFLLIFTVNLDHL